MGFALRALASRDPPVRLAYNSLSNQYQDVIAAWSFKRANLSKYLRLFAHYPTFNKVPWRVPNS